MSTASSTNSTTSAMSTAPTAASSLALLVGEDNKASSSSSGAGGPSPHRRYHFSPMQTMELNNAFSQNPYPSVKYRQELATRLGIDQKTVTTWFKNQRCRLPKILRKQLLEVNGQGSLKRGNSNQVPTVPKINPQVNTALTGSEFLNNGNSIMPFQFYQSNDLSESSLEGLKSVMLSKDKMQKALAQILQMQKNKNADDLDSNGTKTPEAIMDTEDKDNDKIDDSVDVEEIEEKQTLEKTDLLSMIHKQTAAATIPGFPNWNLENYTNYLHRAEKLRDEKPEEEVKPNHLSTLLEEYGDMLSQKAKHYLAVDFALTTENTSADNDAQNGNEKLSEIIKSQWLDYFPKWMAGETGSGFEGVQSLIIADQIVLNRMYQEELKRRQKH